MRIIPGLGTRTGSALLFSTTERFCDINSGVGTVQKVRGGGGGGGLKLIIHKWVW